MVAEYIETQDVDFRVTACERSEVFRTSVACRIHRLQAVESGTFLKKLPPPTNRHCFFLVVLVLVGVTVTEQNRTLRAALGIASQTCRPRFWNHLALRSSRLGYA